MEEGAGYSWEESYKRSWDVLKEDESGSLSDAIRHLKKSQHAFYQHLKQKERNLLIQRGILRYLVLVVDTTFSMTADKTDFAPLSRWQVTQKVIGKWIQEYTDQNPMSQVCGIELTDEGQAENWASMDGRSTIVLAKWQDLHSVVMKRANLLMASSSSGAKGSSVGVGGSLGSKRNSPSLQKGLEMAINILQRYPSHASREIICIMADLGTNDPSNMTETIEKLHQHGIRSSIVSLAAETRIFRHVTEKTNGDYYVIVDEHHYDEVMMSMALPPPRILVQNALEKRSEMIKMAFPRQIIRGPNDVCYCGYKCPQCSALVCQVPLNCPVCGIMLVLAPHLARSYHHLFPSPVYNEVSRGQIKSSSNLACLGCCKNPIITIEARTGRITGRNSIYTSGGGGGDYFECSKCKGIYCMDCDNYVHDTLHQCPSCLLLSH